MHVILVGAGVGGLTAALALRRRGVDVTLIEQAPRFGEVGAGVQLSANATRILFGLGLEPALRAIASAPLAAEVRERRSGALMLRTAFGQAGEARWGAPYLQVHRADLHALLVAAVAAEGGVEVRLGLRVGGVGQGASEARLRLKDPAGAAAELKGDAVVGCDGVHSTVRAALWGETPARFTGQLAWRGLVDAGRLATFGVKAPVPVAAVWTGAGRHFVAYPVRGGALMNFVGVVDEGARSSAGARSESWSAPGDRGALEAAFDGWPEPVTALTRAATAPWRYAIYDRPPLPVWSRGRITLLGDAAHPAPPFLAQGAAMAIEDGEALARRLAAAAGSIDAALRAYEAERRDRTARVQAWSRRNAWLFHLPGVLARSVFGAASRLDQVTGNDAGARLDWLYGYRPPA